MLGQVESNVRVESADDILLNIELVGEGEEDLSLVVFAGRGSGAVCGVGGVYVAASVGVSIRIEPWCYCEDGGKGGEGGEED